MRNRDADSVNPVVHALFGLGLVALLCFGFHEFWNFANEQQAALDARAANEKKFEEFVARDPSRFQTLEEARKAFDEIEQKAAYKEFVEKI